MLYDKLKNRHNITDLQDKITNRLYSRGLKTGNKIQLAELKIINTIGNILLEGKVCQFCGKTYPIIDLQEIDGDKICQDCIDNNFSYCSACEGYVYNDNIHFLNNEVYCPDCYFLEKQNLYNSHVIKNKKLKALARLFRLKNRQINCKDLLIYNFKIDSHLWSIENYADNNFRLGSFGANNWIDIGNNENSLLRAIDYNLGHNRDKLTDITI